MAGNKHLHDATRNKKDEYYTQFNDIANELKNYKEHFKGKVVLCNCDDPYESNFSKYFFMNFNRLGLKKLICTCWNGSPITSTQLDLFEEKPEKGSRSKLAYKIELTEVKDLNGDGAIDITDVRIFLENNKPDLLKGNGDFRSPECIELLKEADIVVTNPPFSLFLEYVMQLMEYNKKFIIIGNKNSIACKEIFPLVKENKIWVGVTPMTKDLHFMIPQEYIEDIKNEDRKTAIAIENGMILGRSPAIWYTNLEHKKRNEPIDNLYKRYYRNPEDYPKYDNYDVIEVGRVTDIPIDYDGIMGVPITFLDKYCPTQFEILGCTQRGCHDQVPDTKKYDDYREINRATDKPTGSSGGKTNENAVCLGKGNKKTYFVNAEGRMVHSEYSRIFIRKKQ